MEEHNEKERRANRARMRKSRYTQTIMKNMVKGKTNHDVQTVVYTLDNARYVLVNTCKP